MQPIRRNRLFPAAFTRLAAAAVAMTVLGAVKPCAAAESDWSKIVIALGKSGTEMPGGVYRVGSRARICTSLWTVSNSSQVLP